MCNEKARSPEDCLEIRKPAQTLDTASAARRLRQGKRYEDHGRSVINLVHGSSLRAMLTTIATGRRTGERRVAGPSTIHVLEGEVIFEAGQEQHELSAGGVLILGRNVPYEAQALTEATFLQTLLLSGAEGAFPQPVHPTEPAEGRADLALPGADRASG
jgi:quercetin dioxygenase-like cupin family protein